MGVRIIVALSEFRQSSAGFFPQYWNQQSIGFFTKVPRYFGSFTFLAIQYETRWAALLPTASNKPQILMVLTRIRSRSVALHRLQQLIQHFQIFIFRLELPVLFQRRRSGIQVSELVINQRQVEVDE